LRRTVPTNPKSVLSQNMIALSLSRNWPVDNLGAMSAVVFSFVGAIVLWNLRASAVVDINILCRLFQNPCRRRAAFAGLNLNCGFPAEIR
jgi:hypothetical protein